VHRARGVQVWARSKLSRRTLLRKGQAPGVVVVCARGCRVRGDALLAAGGKALPTSRRRTMAALTAGEPDVLSLTLGDAERRVMLRLRKPRARFGLSIRSDGGGVTSLRRSIPLGG
jgi:hypothetical protein